MSYEVSPTWATVFIIAAIWELTWKGIALWHAARRDQPGWYVAILIINTVGILPIIYLLTHHDTTPAEPQKT